MSNINITEHIKKRIEFIDALKGFAILTVLWGHSIQYFRNGHDFFQNPVFEFLYSFHMPLFFLISGFFFHSSLKLNFGEFLAKKSLQLLLPCLIWGITFAFIWFVIEIKKGLMPDVYMALTEIARRSYGIWFLRELFLSYLFVFLFMRVFEKPWLAFLISICFVLFSPYLLEKQRVFLPIFWAGFFLKNYYHYIYTHTKTILLVTAIIFASCLVFWDGNYTIYETAFPSLFDHNNVKLNFTNFDISMFRLFIGLIGSVFFFTLFQSIYANNTALNWLSKIGVNTLAIYLLQRLILETVLAKILDFPNINIWVYDLVVTPLVSLFVLYVCLIIIHIVQKNKYAELLLFGKQ